MGQNWKTLEAFFDGLSEEEMGRVIGWMGRHSLQGPLTRAEWERFDPPVPVRERSKEETERLAHHAEACAVLATAREAFSAALDELRKAEGRRGGESVAGHMIRTREQEALVQRLARVVEEREEDFKAAAAAEVAARPHQTKRRKRVAFPLAGIFTQKGADFSSEYTNAEVRR